MDQFDVVPARMDYVFASLWAMPDFVVTPQLSADDGGSYLPVALDLFFDNPGYDLADELLNNVVRRDPGY